MNVAEELADPDDVDSQVIWRSARAKLLARQGRANEAILIAQQAVELASTTDDIERQADALRDLAAALEIAGRPHDEGPSLRKALHLYERKGDVVQAGRIRDRLARSAVG